MEIPKDAHDRLGYSMVIYRIRSLCGTSVVIPKSSLLGKIAASRWQPPSLKKRWWLILYDDKPLLSWDIQIIYLLRWTAFQEKKMQGPNSLSQKVFECLGPRVNKNRWFVSKPYYWKMVSLPGNYDTWESWMNIAAPKKKKKKTSSLNGTYN